MSCPNCSTPPTESQMLCDDIFDVIDDSEASLVEVIGALRAVTLIYEKQFQDIFNEQD